MSSSSKLTIFIWGEILKEWLLLKDIATLNHAMMAKKKLNISKLRSLLTETIIHSLRTSDIFFQISNSFLQWILNNPTSVYLEKILLTSQNLSSLQSFYIENNSAIFKNAKHIFVNELNLDSSKVLIEILMLADEMTHFSLTVHPESKLNLNNTINTLASSCTKLTSCNLSNCFNLSVQSVINICSEGQLLTQLNIENCYHMDEHVIDAITIHCNNLHSLNIKGCVKITKFRIAILAYYHRRKFTEFRTSCKLSDYVLKMLIDQMGSELSMLDIGVNAGLNRPENNQAHICLTDDSIQTITKDKCPELTHLYISNHRELTVVSIRSLSQLNLLLLDITGLSNITIDIINKHLCGLQYICFHNMHEQWFLLRALQMRYYMLAELLFRSEVNINAYYLGGWNILMFAVFYDYPQETIKFLLNSGANINALRMVQNAEECVYGNDPQLTPLMIATKDGLTKCMQELLQSSNIDVNIKNNRGWNALHFSCTSSANASNISLLIAKGADCDACDENNETPLIKASRCANLLGVQELSRSGANLNHVNNAFQSALLCSIQSTTKGSLDVLKHLIAFGADIDKCDNDGNNLIWHCVKENKLMHMNALIKAGVSVNTTNKKHITPLLYSTEYANIGIIEALIRAGADIDAQDENGYTFLIMCILKCGGRVSLTKAQLILRHKTAETVNIQDKLGQTALMHCAKNDSRWQFLDILLEAGANMYIKDNNGFDAFYYAEHAPQTKPTPTRSNFSGWNKPSKESFKNLLLLQKKQVDDNHG